MITKKLHNVLLHCMILTALLLLSVSTVEAQRASAHATIQPTEILIGEQALINVKVISPKDKTISFPVYESEIVPGIEVITMLPPDTLIENNVMTLNFKYVVTSFDSTLYHIPYIPVFDGTDTIFSNSFGLKVTSPDLSDSTLSYLEKMNRGRLILSTLSNFSFMILSRFKSSFCVDRLSLDLMDCAGCCLVNCIDWVDNISDIEEEEKGYIFKPPVVQPAHVRALKDLDKLKAEKLWLQGREKEFYSKLTDILRHYIYEREGINAMEMTTGEILNEVRKIGGG